MSDSILVAKADKEVFLLPNMANRHGLITGATGTGKTVTLQGLAEAFSSLGVPVFLSDIKGDLSGLCEPGGNNPKVTERIKQLKLKNRPFQGFPVEFWDIFGQQGIPIRTTVSEMGPTLLARILELNDVQTGVLSLVFRVADDQNMPRNTRFNMEPSPNNRSEQSNGHCCNWKIRAVTDILANRPSTSRIF